MKKTIALFGGSFNPPHVGHTLAVAYALSQHNIDHLFVVPVFKHVWAKELAPYHHRREMAYLSMGWLPQITVSDIEQELGISRTLDTIEYLSKCYPEHNIQLIAGSDVLDKKEKWYRFDKLEELASLIAFKRIGTSNVTNVSSTFIRHLIGNDGKLSNPLLSEMLAPKVRVYIKNNCLYRNDKAK